MLEKIMNPQVRKYLYYVGVAVLALLVARGVLSPEELQTWEAVVAALVGMGLNGMAARNAGE